MKKNNKRVFAVLFAVMLSLCMGATAFANENTPDLPMSAPNADGILEAGIYDLGDGMTLTVAPIPPAKSRLWVTNSNMPLTVNSWSWFCSDTPKITTATYIYHHGGPGNINICIKLSNIPGSELPYYGLQKGYYATINRGIMDYNLYLSASVQGNYSVEVADWKL